MLFLILIAFNSCCILIHVDTENGRPNLAVAVPTGALISVVNGAIELLQIKQLKIYRNTQKKQYIY